MNFSCGTSKDLSVIYKETNPPSFIFWFLRHKSLRCKRRKKPAYFQTKSGHNLARYAYINQWEQRKLGQPTCYIANSLLQGLGSDVVIFLCWPWLWRKLCTARILLLITFLEEMMKLWWNKSVSLPPIWLYNFFQLKICWHSNGLANAFLFFIFNKCL